MPRSIFDIDELLRSVIDELGPSSQRSTVSLALASRSFEEPALSSIWRRKPSLHDLVMVLPTATATADVFRPRTVVRGSPTSISRPLTVSQEIEREPSTEDWARLRRYASWIRDLSLGHRVDVDHGILVRLRSASEEWGALLPNLLRLRWNITRTDAALPFFKLFLSPRLQRVGLYSYQASQAPSPDQVSTIARFISALPTSVQDLDVVCGDGGEGGLEGPLTSFLSRPGRSVGGFGARVPLSEAATLGIVQLPNLHRWRTSQEPPKAVSGPVLPSLEHLHLDEGRALPWLNFLHARGTTAPTGDPQQPRSARKTLKAVVLATSVASPALLSSLANFRDLATVGLGDVCSGTVCRFRLTDGDVKDFAASLPRLKSMRLGMPCGNNACKTTVSSLVSISTHCPDLMVLEIHFNTEGIQRDMRRLLNSGPGRHRSKCKLRELFVLGVPLALGETGVQTVARGLRRIFPHLTNLTTFKAEWFQVAVDMGVYEYPWGHSGDVFL
jgi:hypothetical protein